MTYFYEADCGSETINPKKDPPVSIYKKMLAYYYTHKLNLHTELWGIKDFRVLIVTTNQKRMQHMIDVSKVFNDGAGSELFLFTTLDQVRSIQSVFELILINGLSEELTLIFSAQ